VKVARILCLDVGDKRIGVALSDPLGILASPLTIIERRNHDADIAGITGLVTAYQAARVVVGLPLSLSGKISQQTGKVQVFAAELAAAMAVPLTFHNESLSTITAQELLKQRGRKHGHKIEHDDAAAACVILQSYLDENPVAQHLSD
jgi:putative Holliday junction resolvase